MKITSLKIRNIGIITDTTLNFDKPLLLFYGEIRQGKTTILNAVRWVCGGAFPSDIIQHGAKEASIELGFDGGCIRREWYVAKDKSTKAREVQFIRAGKPVANPVYELKRMMNPFMLNQDFLRNMSELERKKYFTEQFAVDTTALDTELFNSERKASDLRSEIKGYGEIDVTKVEKVDVTALQATLKETRDAHAKAVESCTVATDGVRSHNDTVRRAVEKAQSFLTEITDLKLKLKTAESALKATTKWIEEHPLQPAPDQPKAPDTSGLETKIQNAAAQNVRAEQYQKNVARAKEKEGKEKELKECETRQREIRAEKIKKLKGVSETCGIKDLAFDEDGNFTYQGTTAGMLSTSQIMKLSTELSAMYPPGFSIELIDRGESLGRSIFDYVEHAQKHELTVLAAIVGQAPAQAPEKIGVYVVEDGTVLPQK